MFVCLLFFDGGGLSGGGGGSDGVGANGGKGVSDCSGGTAVIMVLWWCSYGNVSGVAIVIGGQLQWWWR